MPSNKFIFTLVGLVLAIFAICKMDMGSPTVENWWGTAGFTATAVPAYCTENGPVAMGGNYLNTNTMGSGKFFQTANMQGILSPRMQGVANVGANIRYNMPDRKNMAVPCNPLTFGDMASDSKENYNTKENYSCGGQCSGGCGPSCGKGGYGLGKKVGGGYELPSGYTAGNWQQVYDSLPGKPVGPPPGPHPGCGPHPLNSSDLPIGTMDVVDGAGNMDQIVPFNRLMYANRNSKLRGQGDPIRGDLAIVPCQTGWFSVYPNINVDLQAGAMNVMAGANAGNSELLQLMVQASGGAIDTYGGVSLKEQLNSENVNMSNQAITSLSNALGDVTATAYP